MAGKHAAKLSELEQRHAMPYLRVATFNCRGMAKAVARDFHGAIAEFNDALTLVRSANGAKEHEIEIMVSMAECLRATGEFEQALALATESLDISRQRSARVTECRALVACAAAMLDAYGPEKSADAEKMFGEAEGLLQVTGARIFERPLQMERSRLAQYGAAVRASAISAQAG
jgi:adenylate cyclase